MHDHDTRLDIAWAAGLFEGEGCFHSSKTGNRTRLIVNLAMTDEDVVKRFAEIVGVGAYRGMRKRRPNEKPVYEWAAQNGADCWAIAELFMPYLGRRRAARASEMIAAIERMDLYAGARTHCPAGHPLDDDNVTAEIRRYRLKSGEVREITHRRCKICRASQSRERARRVKGIKPENYRV